MLFVLCKVILTSWFWKLILFNYCVLVNQNILQQTFDQKTLLIYWMKVKDICIVLATFTMWTFGLQTKCSTKSPLPTDTEFKASLSFFCLAVTSCDFESLCLWTLSNHSDQSDWSVVSPRQPESAQVGLMPETDHSEGSSDGKRLTEEKINESFRKLPTLSSSLKHIKRVENPAMDHFLYFLNERFSLDIYFELVFDVSYCKVILWHLS